MKFFILVTVSFFKFFLFFCHLNLSSFVEIIFIYFHYQIFFYLYHLLKIHSNIFIIFDFVFLFGRYVPYTFFRRSSLFNPSYVHTLNLYFYIFISLIPLPLIVRNCVLHFFLFSSFHIQKHTFSSWVPQRSYFSHFFKQQIFPFI